ncbi:unnamed protein product [Leptidea sinapis]|uniref:SAM domain-containing protein n=1 Tax=Leptidea sinapis TaxID=189913 RepID=A0A5E4PUA6_9NEOP|nr:unnamed protein product [Leptidea sinapis]
MAKTVRKVKRGKGKETSNDSKCAAAIIVTPRDNLAMTIKDTTKVNDQLNDRINAALNDVPIKMEFNVNQLISELSQNSRASKTEIENIQRKLLQQANEILKVNAFANTEPRVSYPEYGRIPVVGYSGNVANLEVCQGAQLVPEKLQESAQDIMINTRRVNSVVVGRDDFFSETGSTAARLSTHLACTRGTVEGVPPYRMPPAPEAALPGAPAPTIEREVILSSSEKNSKVPILQEARKRGRLGAVAPDTPPKPLTAWIQAENQQAGTSGDIRNYHDHYGYTRHQNQGLPRSQNYETPKPPIPAKNTPNNSHMVTVVETGKDNTRDAPKSAKSVSKTYHTLKDMISNRFKGKESIECDKTNDEANLNNTEERKREPEAATREGVRKVEQGIYGRPMPQARPEMQYNHGMANNVSYPSPSPHRQLVQQQIYQQQMMLNHQARSQEMLAHRPQALGADALYQQYGAPGRRSAMYQRDLDVRSMANFTSLKTGTQPQVENSHSRPDLRSPQQLEREIIQQRRFVEGRRAASHPHLLEEPQQRQEVISPQIHDRSRRNSYGNLLDGIPNENGPPRNEERESDDGGFKVRHAQGRNSVEERIRTSGRSVDSRQERNQEIYRRTPDSQRESRRTPDTQSHRRKDISNSGERENNDESASQKSADSVYNSSGKAEAYNPQPSSSRLTPNRIEDLKALGKKGAGGSAASSDYDKNGGQSSNVDSGRGSVAYSSGRQPDASLHETSADSDAATRETRAQPQPGPSGENEWADLVECELRQILEPKLSNMRLDSSDSSDSSVTPPLPPLSPSSDLHKRNSLPGRSAEYPEDRRRGRESPRWHSHKKHSSKRDHHYKKHLFGLDTTDMTSTTTRSLDLSSLLDGRTDSDASTGDARAIRRQLRGLENINPDRVKRLTKFFGDEPPLMRLFLKKLGYEKYAALLEKEKVGAAELPYVGEDKLRALGVPLGPRMRILKEAGIHQDLHFPRDDPNTTTTTLAIV